MAGLNLHSEAALYRRYVEFAKLMSTYLAHFPKAEKYGLAQAIRVAAYDVYALIVECQKRYHKKTTLTALDVRHEQLRMLLLLAHDLGYFGWRDGAQAGDDGGAARRYLAISKRVDELGRMIGGWIKSERQDLAAQAAARGEVS